MNILIAPDSFKDSLSAVEVSHYLAESIRHHYADVEVTEVPVADGGEGTVAAMVAATKGKLVDCTVSDPQGRDIKATYGVIDNNVAIIEMCAAAGISLLKTEERNPMFTTTIGVGEMLIHSMPQADKVYVGLGGSATNDMGAGMAFALGYQFLDRHGKSVHPTGSNLINVEQIIPPSYTKIKAQIIAACDVNNPLIGPNGAAHIYARQKGASDDDIMKLDNGLAHLVELVKRDLGKDVATISGAGAAGGFGAGLVAFCDASLISGFDMVKTATNLEDKIKSVDVVITGEGQLDHQTSTGKVVSGVLELCKQHRKRLIAVAGNITSEGQQWCDENEVEAYSLSSIAGRKKEAIANPKKYIEEMVKELF